MKIKEITDGYIKFDNGNSIWFDHEQDCCENNYADFSQIDEEAVYNIEFDENLKFEVIDKAGFRFGSCLTNMVFVPCYSEQNGYYTTHLDIYYNKTRVIGLKAKMLYDDY